MSKHHHITTQKASLPLDSPGTCILKEAWRGGRVYHEKILILNTTVVNVESINRSEKISITLTL